MGLQGGCGGSSSSSSSSSSCGPASASSPALALLLLLLLLVGRLVGAGASSGDASIDFWRCARTCEVTGCTDSAIAPSAQRCSPLCQSTRPAGDPRSAHGARPPPVPLPLRLGLWDCAADCRYLCMWQREAGKAAAAAAAASNSQGSAATTAAAAAAAAPAVEKYFGKWPFRRLLGMQEPASVLFSLLNMAAQLRCLRCYARLARRASQWGSGHAGAGPGAAAPGPEHDRAAAWACRPLWVVHFSFSAAAWLASAVFHARDTRLTERLDYYSAGALVTFNLFLTAVRTLRLSSRPARAVFGALLLGAYARHIHRMQFVLFDYGLHVKACIAAGLAQAALWVYWASAAAPRAHRGRRWLLAFVGLIHASMLFEVLDFPPLWAALDAHACWHLCTVPLAYVWYRFVSADCDYGAGSSHKHEL